MDKVKILFLAADPSDSARLRLGQELRDIREKLQLSKQREKFFLESRESVRPGDITQSILDIEPKIVHFSGHGMSTGELCCEDILGKTQPVPLNAITNLFKLVATHVSCVVLNACYSTTQAEAIAKHIPFVIGMDKAIGDRAAIAFAVGFYKALGAGRSFEDAYSFACVEIQLENIPEFLTPVLHTRELASNTGNKPDRAKYMVVLSATIDEVNKPLLEAIVAHLSQVSGDASLTLRKIEEGSIKLFFEGSPEGFEHLDFLFRTGQLTSILGIEIQDLESINADESLVQLDNSNQFSQESENEFDIRLQQLAEEAIRHEAQSPMQRKALNRLITAIMQSNRLFRPPRSLLSDALYEERYNEALQKTLLQVTQRIQDYNLAQPVMSWVNFLLRSNFKYTNWAFRNATLASPETEYSKVVLHSMDAVEMAVSDRSQEDSEIVDRLRRFLAEDPEKRLRKSIKGHPDVTFQYLLLARLDGRSWQELSRTLNVSVVTLSAFYQRQLKGLVPYFQQYLRE